MPETPGRGHQAPRPLGGAQGVQMQVAGQGVSLNQTVAPLPGARPPQHTISSRNFGRFLQDPGVVELVSPQSQPAPEKRRLGIGLHLHVTVALGPLLHGQATGEATLVLAYGAILSGGVYATRPEPWLSGLCSALATGLVGLNLYFLFWGSSEVTMVLAVALIVVTFLFGVFAASRTLIMLMSAPAADADALAGAVFGYFLLVVVWALFFRALEIWSPGAFAFAADADPSTELLYFSLVTITTLGYGDISPVDPLARISAGLEAATGTLYIAILIARIVGAVGGGRLR